MRPSRSDGDGRALGAQPAQPPVRRHRGEQAERQRLVGPYGPAQRRHEVAVLGAQPGQPVQLPGLPQVGLGGLGQAEEVGGVRRARGLALAGLGQPLARRTPGSCSACGSGRRESSTSDLSTRSASSSSTSSAGRPHTRAAASRVAPPAKTVSRRASVRSSSRRRSQLHSTTARSVRCRGAFVRSPRDSSRNRSSRRAATSSTVSERSRAAASSMARGSPSSAAQIRWIVASSRGRIRGRGVRRRPGRRTGAPPDRPSASTASASGGGSASGGSGHSASPVMPSASRLVASTRSPGQAPSRRWASRAASSTTCSQLSRMSRIRRSCRAATSRPRGVGLVPRRLAEQAGLPQSESLDHRLDDRTGRAASSSGPGRSAPGRRSRPRPSPGRRPRRPAGSCRRHRARAA